MTVKADAHFVDCDLATGDGSFSWTSDFYQQWRRVAHTFDTTLALSDTSPDTVWSVALDNVGLDVDIAIDGYTAACQRVSTSDSANPIVLVDALGNDQGVDFDWGVSFGDNITASSDQSRVAFSPDGQYMYFGHKYTGGTNSYRIIKYDREGNRIWRKIFEGFASGFNHDLSLAIEVPIDGYIYRGSGGSTKYRYPCKIDPSNGNTVLTWSAPYAMQATRSCISETNRKIYFGANTRSQSIPAYTLVYSIDMDSDTTVTLTSTADKNVWDICTNDEYVYIIGQLTGGNLQKLNASTLAVEATTTLVNGVNVWIDFDGYLAVAQNSAPDNIVILDPDSLAVVDTFPMSGGITNSTALGQSTAAPPGALAVQSTQYRQTAYPQDWAHLEGQTVQVLKNGTYLGTDTVSGGQITLDD